MVPLLAMTSNAGLFGWQMVDVPMLIALPILLALSAFFSACETALFGLTDAQRLALRTDESLAARAAATLLDDERMLLITILLGNMTANVLYFIISSVLLMHATEAGPLTVTLLAFVFLLIAILFGEVGPKTLANALRKRFVPLVAPPLLALHRVFGPIRTALNRAVVAPLSRLTAPSAAPPELHEDELRDLLALSGGEGVIDPEEQRILREVVRMHRLKVRDVMTPRVRMVALPKSAGRRDVERAVERSRLTRLPVYRRDLDHVVGVLNAKRFLLDPSVRRVASPAVMRPAHYVPDLATLDQLLDHFRRTHTQSAIVVDEYGGTEGIVSVEDVVEELVGDIVFHDEDAVEPPRLIGLNRWRVGGDVSVFDFADAFNLPLDNVQASTLSGWIVHELGRSPRKGDSVRLRDVQLDVQTVRRRRVVTAIVSVLQPNDRDALSGAEEQP